jgi:tetratricopeptide (TPR) repeat protein
MAYDTGAVMFKLKIIALSIGCAGLVTGCALFQRSAPKTPLVQPVVKVQHGRTEAQAKYELGRYYYAQRRTEEARRALEESLALDAALSRASNVLGVVYASQGRYEEAQSEFKRALQREPHAAHLHSNMGYAYLLQGRNDDALASFEEALRLEPQNEKAGSNLRIARERLGLEARSAKPTHVGHTTATKTDLGRSASVESSKLRIVEISPNVYELTLQRPITSASLGSSGPLAASALISAQAERSPVVETAEQLPSASGNMVVEVSPNVYELEKAAPAVVTSVAPQNTSSEAPPSFSRLGLEVSNGNGIRGMAKQVAAALRSQGIGVTRLSNRKPFDQLRTEIEYRKGYLISARELGVRLPSPPSFVESGSLGAGIGVRLVLGKDLNKNVVLVDPDTSDATRLASLP